MEKKCNVCVENKPVFTIDSCQKGRIITESICIECFNEYIQFILSDHFGPVRVWKYNEEIEE